MNSIRLEPIDGKVMPTTDIMPSDDPDKKRRNSKSLGLRLPTLNDIDNDLQKLNKLFDAYATKKTIATGKYFHRFNDSRNLKKIELI